jgi:hypothetical protein
MKKLAFAVALMLSSASHADRLEAPNRSGGKIVLTDRKGACENGLVMYSTLGSGRFITGCWWPIDGRIGVQYDASGETRLYEESDFTFVQDKPEEKPAKSKKQYQSM